MQENNTLQIQNDIQKLFGNLNDVLNRSHLMISETFDIFLDLVFIKAIYTLNLENKIDTKNEWEKIISVPDPKHYILYHVMSSLIESDDTNINFYFNSSYTYMESIDEQTFKRLLNLVNTIPSEQLSPHQRYEYIANILDQGMKFFGKGGGHLSFRTPKVLRDFLTNILDPKADDRIADLSCGTGALLLSAYTYIQEHSNVAPNNIYYGVDISKQMLRIAIMHSYISGMKTLDVERRDVLRDFIAPNHIARYDKVYATPPFNVRVRPDEISKEFSIQSRYSDILFLESTMALLSEKGLASLIVVGNTLFGSSPVHIEIRRRLVEEMHVEAIVSLPIKLPFTAIPLYLIIFKNEIHQRDILFLDLNADINAKETKNIIDERLKLGISVYRNYVQAGYNLELKSDCDLYWTVSKDEVRENGYSLAPHRYRPIKDIDVPQIGDILIDLKQQCLTMIDDMNMLTKSINTVPKLSSKDFAEVTLNDICDIGTGRPLPRDKEIEGGDLPWIQIRDITKSSEFSITKSDDSVSEEFAQRHRLIIVEKNDILISVRGTIGTAAIAGKRMCIGPNVMVLRVQNEQVNPWFLFGWLLENKTKFENQSRGTIPMITRSQLRSMKIKIPTLANQEHFVEYYNAMKKVQEIKQLSESNNTQISQMTNALFHQYFQVKD